MKKLRIRIANDGKVQIEVEGAIGPECREFSHGFETAIGKVLKCELKPEYDGVVVPVKPQIESSN